MLIPAELARLPVSVEPLSIFLYVQHRTQSYTIAATALAVYSGATAVAWPLAGRLIDRRGPRPVVGGLAIAHGTALALFVLAAHGPVWCILAAVASVAATVAPMGSTVRASWHRLLEPGPLLDRANAMEAALVEVFFVVGPLLAGLLASLFGPLFATLAAGAVLVAGCAGFVCAPAVDRLWSGASGRTAETGRPRRAWSAPGVPAILAAVGLGAGAFAVLEVAIPDTVASRGMAPSIGVALLSLPPAASFGGGLLYGTRRHASGPFERYLRLLTAMSVCMAPLVVPAPVAVLAICLFIAGLPLAAVSSEEFGLLGSLARKGALNETFALAAMMMALGGAVGNLAAGAVAASAGTVMARLLAPGMALMATTIVWLGRSTLSAGDTT